MHKYHNVCFYVSYVHVQPLQIAQTDLLRGCDELTCEELTVNPYKHTAHRVSATRIRYRPSDSMYTAKLD